MIVAYQNPFEFESPFLFSFPSCFSPYTNILNELSSLDYSHWKQYWVRTKGKNLAGSLLFHCSSERSFWPTVNLLNLYHYPIYICLSYSEGFCRKSWFTAKVFYIIITHYQTLSKRKIRLIVLLPSPYWLFKF